MALPDAPRHVHALAILPADIDFMGHVNNAVYLKWVQEAVIAYWRRVAPAEAVARHLWVAIRHEITYRRPAFLDDALVASVVAEGVQGARAFFSTLITRGEDDLEECAPHILAPSGGRGGEVILAEVKSSWCCLDAATMRPARLARDVVRRFLPD